MPTDRPAADPDPKQPAPDNGPARRTDRPPPNSGDDNARQHNDRHRAGTHGTNCQTKPAQRHRIITLNHALPCTTIILSHVLLLS